MFLQNYIFISKDICNENKLYIKMNGNVEKTIPIFKVIIFVFLLMSGCHRGNSEGLPPAPPSEGEWRTD